MSEAARIHNAEAAAGTGRSPTMIDLPHARVAILTGRDALFPELSTHLVKEGADIVLIPSSVSSSFFPIQQPLMHVWDRSALFQAWKTSTNHGFHLAASDSGGFGLIIGGGFPGRKEVLDGANPVVALGLDAGSVRQSRFLNAYYPFDLNALLATARRAVAK
jgi:predicted amidohydrolase